MLGQTAHLREEYESTPPYVRSLLVSDDSFDFTDFKDMLAQLSVGTVVIFRDENGNAAGVLLHPAEYELLRATAALTGDTIRFQELVYATSGSHSDHDAQWMSFDQVF